MRFALNTDLLLGHGFEQSRLSLGGGPVDFVGQHDVMKNRAGMEGETLFGRVKDFNADDIRRKQVGSKLNTSEIGV